MKVVVFGTALLACAIPAFGQVETTFQPSSPATAVNCQAALFAPGVPSAIVVLTVPTLAAPAAGGLGSGASLESRPSTAMAQPGTFSRPSSRPGGIVLGAGGSGLGGGPVLGGGTLSGVGQMERSGIGSIGTGGIGGIGMGGIGSIPSYSPALPPSRTSSASPFAAPPIQSPAAGAPSRTGSAITHPLPVTLHRLPFICP